MKKFIRKYFWYVPAIIWMLVIFNLSGQVGQASGRLSLQVTEKIVDVIEVVRGGDEEDAYRLTVKLHPYVRKLAHMTEYGILYTLLMLSFLASMVTTRSMS
ncbi:MAG: VanZ family protein, partial [Planctomycetia bacterium]|nr:VanZ family protein [Planctomycetia bacterium]